MSATLTSTRGVSAFKVARRRWIAFYAGLAVAVFIVITLTIPGGYVGQTGPTDLQRPLLTLRNRYFPPYEHLRDKYRTALALRPTVKAYVHDVQKMLQHDFYGPFESVDAEGVFMTDGDMVGFRPPRHIYTLRPQTSPFQAVPDGSQDIDSDNMPIKWVLVQVNGTPYYVLATALPLPTVMAAHHFHAIYIIFVPSLPPSLALNRAKIGGAGASLLIVLLLAGLTLRRLDTREHLRRAEAGLARCAELIYEVEVSLQLPLLDPADLVARRYGAALDSYAQARDQLQGGAGRAELPEAELLLEQTISDLEIVRDSLGARSVKT